MSPEIVDVETKIKPILDKYQHKVPWLLSILQESQTQYNYLPKEALVYIAKDLGLPLARVYGVATFFKAFSLKPRGRHVVTICCGTACHVRGGQRLVDKVMRDHKIQPGDMTPDGRFSFETANCLGCCALGPVVVVDGKYENHVTQEKLDRILSKCD